MLSTAIARWGKWKVISKKVYIPQQYSFQFKSMTISAISILYKFRKNLIKTYNLFCR